MDNGNVVSLFPRQQKQQVSKDQLGFLDEKSLTLTIWNKATRTLRYESQSLSGPISKNQLADLIDDYRNNGEELLHAFVGAECQVLRYFVELEDDEDSA